jgi:hypothetical protein
MKNFFGRIQVGYFFVCAIFLSLLMPMTAHARAVDEVKFKLLPDGYEVIIKFLFTIQYQSQAPNNPAKDLYVQLKTINFRTLTSQEVDSLRERVTLGPDPASNIPLLEITFNGADAERPQMTFLFSEEVTCDVRSSGDLRSLIVKVKTKQPPAALPQEKEKTPEKKLEKEAKEISLPEMVIPQDQSSLAKLMEDARDALIKGEYDRAVQLYTKILLTAQGPVKQQAQESLGIARERNGQLAHAKAEYQKYLDEFPKGPDADRVRQRLAGLITAAKTPKEKLKEAKRAAKGGKGKWVAQNYGTFSQFYFRDQTIPEGGQARVNRSDLSSDLNLNSRWKSDDLEFNARFTGGHQQNFLEDRQDQDSISALSIDMRSRKNGWYGKFGRQSLSTGGVFGRFDGGHLAVKLNPVVKLSGVFGYPVETVRHTDVKTNKRFYGMNFDFGTFLQKWDFNNYFINQENYGLTDRRAVGAEARYFDPIKAFFTLLDYDIFFKALDIFLFNGHWTLPTKTTLNLILDYRKSPLLTLNNAIIGQGVDKISDLLNSFTEEQLTQLAKDRTANSKSATFGITQDLKKDLQLTTEVSVSELEGTMSSAGVQGEESTGQEYTYSAQLISSNVFKENDVMIYGLSYSDTAQNNIYSLNLNGSFPLTQKMRLMPRLRLDYRDAKQGNGNRSTVRPSMRVDYNFTKWMRCEIEGGIEWIDEKSAGLTQQSTESFISVGYRVNF